MKHLFLLICVMSTLCSCVSLTGFEEARVIGENNSELIVSGNYTQTPDFFDLDDLGEIDSTNTILFPNVELSYKKGISDRIEAGVRYSSNAVLGLFFKYQFYGDASSSFALATGLEGSSSIGIAISIAIPLYISYYPSKNITINLAPRYNYQFILNSEVNGVNYLGGNFGVLFGERNKFGFDIGYYNVNQDIGLDNIGLSLISFGIGGKFRV